MSAFDEILGGITVKVHDHAVYQFSLRFASEAPTDQQALRRFKETIIGEVRDGFRARRFSPHRPGGFSLGVKSETAKDTLFVWTANQLRCYGLRYTEEPPSFMVITTLGLEDRKLAS